MLFLSLACPDVGKNDKRKKSCIENIFVVRIKHATARHLSQMLEAKADTKHVFLHGLVRTCAPS